MENSDFLKGILILAIVLYVISPIDLAPGPIDDLIAIFLGIAGNKALANKSSADFEE